MVISVLIPPDYKPSSPAAAPRVSAQQIPKQCLPEESHLGWCDHALDREWEEAILSFLKEQVGRSAPMWHLINSVAAELRPEDRSELRQAKEEVIYSLKGLIQTRRIRRIRRSTISVV